MPCTHSPTDIQGSLHSNLERMHIIHFRVTSVSTTVIDWPAGVRHGTMLNALNVVQVDVLWRTLPFDQLWRTKLHPRLAGYLQGRCTRADASTYSAGVHATVNSAGYLQGRCTRADASTYSAGVHATMNSADWQQLFDVHPYRCLDVLGGSPLYCQQCGLQG